MGNDGFMQILQNNKRAAVKRHKGSAKTWSFIMWMGESFRAEKTA